MFHLNCAGRDKPQSFHSGLRRLMLAIRAPDLCDPLSLSPTKDENPKGPGNERATGLWHLCGRL
jgi:hypothetical protein